MSSWESCEDGNLVRTGEIVLFVQNETRYHEGDGNLNYDEGKLTLSTDNIFFQPKGAGPIFLRIPLGNIDSPSGGPTVVAQSDGRSPKLHIPLTESGQKAVFSFKVGNIKEFCETLRDVLQQKLLLLRHSEMLTEPLPSITGVVQGSSKATRDDSSAAPANETLLAFTDKAGIAGLMRASAEKTAQGETLRDIDDVMRNASSLVASIRNLQQKQQNIAGTTKAEDNMTIESIEATLGLGATVRASGAGWGLVSAHAGFHKELAWEIHSWITHEKNHHVFGSMPLIPLIELFSLYNKARGECDLVSTNDVLHACRALDQQEYAQYTLKRLSSGRYALQRKDPSIVLKKLEHILGPRLCNEKESGKFTTSADSSPIHNGRDGGVTQPVTQTAVFPESSSMLKGVNEVTFASVLHVTCSVSMDLLEELELQGYLCRSGEAVFEKIRPALEVAEVGAWSKTDITTFMSLVSGFCDIQRQQLRARRGKRRDGHDCEQNVDKEGGCEDGCGVRGEDGDKEDEASLEADSVVVLEIRRSLTKLRHYLQKRIPYGSISEPVVPPAPTSPQEGENSCGGRGAYKALQSSKPVEPPVCAVDAFLYLEEDIDALADQGHISREYCRSCGSVDIGLCQFITHSFSLEQLIFLSCFLLPSFGDTSYCLTSDNFWRPRHKNCHTVAAAFSCEHVVEVGSRLGIVPMSCYFASEQQRLLNTRRVTAIELDKELVALQQEVFQKFAKGPTAVHLNLVHSDCFEGEGLEALRSADIIILHNIFEYFTASAEEHLRSWKRLRAAVVRSGQLLVSCPPLQETLAAFSEDCVRKVFINEQDKVDFVHVHQSNSNAGRISRKRCRQPPQEHSFTLDQWWRSWVKEIDVEHIRRSFLTAQRFCEEDHPCDSSYGDADDELVKELKDMRVYMVQ